MNLTLSNIQEIRNTTVLSTEYTDLVKNLARIISYSCDINGDFNKWALNIAGTITNAAELADRKIYYGSGFFEILYQTMYDTIGEGVVANVKESGKALINAAKMINYFDLLDRTTAEIFNDIMLRYNGGSTTHYSIYYARLINNADYVVYIISKITELPSTKVVINYISQLLPEEVETSIENVVKSGYEIITPYNKYINILKNTAALIDYQDYINNLSPFADIKNFANLVILYALAGSSVIEVVNSSGDILIQYTQDISRDCSVSTNIEKSKELDIDCHDDYHNNSAIATENYLCPINYDEEVEILG